MMTVLKKGAVLKGPEGYGYILAEDIMLGDVLIPSNFTPFGGAPVPKAGNIVPEWVGKAIQEASLNAQ